jgi:hypothetical protein
MIRQSVDWFLFDVVLFCGRSGFVNNNALFFCLTKLWRGFTRVVSSVEQF